MTTMRMLIPTVVLVLAGGQPPAKAQAEAQEEQVAERLKAQMQTILDAWSTMDVSKVAPYYDTDSKLVFYDVAPQKYTGWKEYAEGVQKSFSGLISMKITLGKDARVHVRGDVAWGTATFREHLLYPESRTESGEARWTVIWEKRGEKWLVVHDHISVPEPWVR
jgi:ketosteroid isomerase-like protein